MAARNEKKTTLDSDVTKPSVTEPGDGPADTTDPTERATSIIPSELSDEAIKAGTVNAVKPIPRTEETRRESGKDRIEKYEAVRPNGEKVTVTHNLDTGETSV